MPNWRLKYDALNTSRGNLTETENYEKTKLETL